MVKQNTYMLCLLDNTEGLCSMEYTYSYIDHVHILDT